MRREVAPVAAIIVRFGDMAMALVHVGMRIANREALIRAANGATGHANVQL